MDPCSSRKALGICATQASMASGCALLKSATRHQHAGASAAGRSGDRSITLDPPSPGRSGPFILLFDLIAETPTRLFSEFTLEKIFACEQRHGIPRGRSAAGERRGRARRGRVGCHRATHTPREPARRREPVYKYFSGGDVNELTFLRGPDRSGSEKTRRLLITSKVAGAERLFEDRPQGTTPEGVINE